jgi:hypothetical protein
MIIENLTARTAWPRIGHLPEIVRGVTRALVVADTDDAFGRNADVIGPDVIGFVVFVVDRHPEFFLGQQVHAGQQLPRIVNRITLEVIAETEITKHFEERMVARGVTDIFQVIVLAAGTHAALHGGCAGIRSLISAKEDILELHHAAVCQQHGWIVTGNQRTGTHDRVPLGFEK